MLKSLFLPAPFPSRLSLLPQYQLASLLDLLSVDPHPVLLLDDGFRRRERSARLHPLDSAGVAPGVVRRSFIGAPFPPLYALCDVLC
jgi:hypothetical protein